MIKKEEQKRVVVFGIFDGIHDGHRSLFRQALRLGSKHLAHGEPKEDIELVVIVGRDLSALKLKGKTPKNSEQTRLNLVSKEPDVDKVVLGDKKQGTYAVLQKLDPDIVCFGYDQSELEQDFKAWAKKQQLNISVVRLKPFYPKKYHSSIL